MKKVSIIKSIMITLHFIRNGRYPCKNPRTIDSTKSRISPARSLTLSLLGLLLSVALFFGFRQPGVRMLTLYLYLNDVENGGGTNFDQLDVTVMPKRGRALLWPSVLDSNPDVKDGRTTHQALPVGKDSLKFGANVR